MTVMPTSSETHAMLWATRHRVLRTAAFCLSFLPMLVLAADSGDSLKALPEVSLAMPDSVQDEKPGSPRLVLEAILGKKAVISVNGRRSVLAVGAMSPDGLRLLSLKDAQVTVEFADQQHRLRLGQAPISTRFAQPKLKTVIVAPDRMGMYVTSGAINGYAVKFLVDTGATAVAMNGNTARRLGIDYRLQGRLIPVQTASGQSHGYYIKLREVSVSSIRAHNVDAVVLDGAYPQEILLGMSFLGRFHMQRNGILLELQQKL